MNLHFQLAQMWIWFPPWGQNTRWKVPMVLQLLQRNVQGYPWCLGLSRNDVSCAPFPNNDDLFLVEHFQDLHGHFFEDYERFLFCCRVDLWYMHKIYSKMAVSKQHENVVKRTAQKIFQTRMWHIEDLKYCGRGLQFEFSHDCGMKSTMKPKAVSLPSV